LFCTDQLEDEIRILKTIALIDPFWTGHHSTYLKLYAKTLLSLDHRVMLFCSKPKEIELWLKANTQYQHDKLHLFHFDVPNEINVPVLRLQMAINSVIWWHVTERAIKEATTATGYSPDLVFFAWLDDYLGRFQNHRLIDMLFHYNWSGLYFHPRHLRLPLPHSTARGGHQDYDEALRSKRCTSVALLDEGVAQKLQEKLPNKPVVVFPDLTDSSPVCDIALVHDIITKAAGRTIVTVVGGLAKRKGVLTLLEVSRRAVSQGWFFVFAGALATDSFSPQELQHLKETVANPPSNCYFHFEFLPDEHYFNALIKISDLLFASYEDFPHSSNILTKAAVFKKPVIVSTGGCMAERVRAFRLGACIQYGNVPECMEAIRHLLTPAELHADYNGYLSNHSEQRLFQAFQELL